MPIIKCEDFMGRKKDISQVNDYHAVYESLWNMWYTRIYNMSLSSITWEGNEYYPEWNIPERFLVNKGMCAAFMDDILGFMFLPCNPSNSMNAAGIPSSFTAYGYNDYIKEGLVHGENAVIIRNNPMGIPEIQVINNYVRRLTEIQITQQVNLNANKTPLAMIVPEDQKNTAQNYYSQFSLGKPLLFGNDGMSNVIPSAIITGAPYIVDKLSQELRTVWAELLTYLGTPGMDLQKSERLLQDEIAQAMGGAMACRTARMLQRKKAAELIEKLFGKILNPVYSVDIESVPAFLNQDTEDDEEYEE